MGTKKSPKKLKSNQQNKYQIYLLELKINSKTLQEHMRQAINAAV